MKEAKAPVHEKSPEIWGWDPEFQVTVSSCTLFKAARTSRSLDLFFFCKEESDFLNVALTS
jgi:hypothetical protein